MNKLIYILIFINVSILAVNQNVYGQVDESQIKVNSKTETPCSSYNDEINKLEKEYSFNSQLLASHKKEIENLPPEASSKKMKLTSETFMIAAKIESAQNWIKIKRNEKINKKCSTFKQN